MSGLHFHPLRVQSVQADTADAAVITFEVPSELSATFAFQPGQYLTLALTIGGRRVFKDVLVDVHLIADGASMDALTTIADRVDEVLQNAGGASGNSPIRQGAFLWPLSKGGRTF